MRVLVCVAREKVPDFTSWMIQRVLNFEGSHIFLVYKGRLYHAVEQGICDEDFIEFCKAHDIVKKKEVEFKCEEEDFFLWYRNLQGIGYSRGQYFGFLFPRLRWLFRNKRRKAICSEFVAWAMSDLAVRPEFDDADFISPKDLFERI